MKRKEIVIDSTWKKLHLLYWYVVNSFVSRDGVKVEEKIIVFVGRRFREDMFLCFHCCSVVKHTVLRENED
jgi:hypothetical protein